MLTTRRPELERQVLERGVAELLVEPLPQRPAGVQVGSGAHGPCHLADRAVAVDLTAGHRALPQADQPLDHPVPGVGGDQGAVERADRGAEEDVGVDPGSKRARSMPTSTAPSRPPPPRTKAVGGHLGQPTAEVAPAAGDAAICACTCLVARHSAQRTPQPWRSAADQGHRHGERQAPAGLVRQQEGAIMRKIM